MALLQRVRILPNERLDLPDFNRIEDFMCADLKAIHKNIWSSQNFVFSGFAATGTGTTTLSVALANSSLVVGQDDGAVFIGAPSLAALSSNNLSPGTTNYIEITLDQDTGGADSRAFWDQTANSGLGAEFSQIIDTFTFLKATLKISTSNFSGSADAVKICEVDVNGSGVITQIRDKRDLFFRLGRGTNPTFTFPWSSRTEPANTNFSGADKDIKNQKMMNDALMDSVREIKGTTYWYEVAPVSLQGAFRNSALSVLVGSTAGARMAWSGTALSITDDAGSPTDGDVVAYLRLFDLASDLGLSRQDGGNAIPIADGQVLWIEVPNPVANTTYDGVGATASNYRVTARGSVPLDQDTYWLAYREGTKLYLRDLGELEAGEAAEITDQVPEALKTFLGFNPETATSVPYTAFPNGAILPATYTINDSLRAAIDADTTNINFIAAILNKNPYEERLDIVVGAPVNDNEYQGPVAPSTVIPLPLDSRDGDSTETYIVGQGQLMAWLNGVYSDNGIDWEEVGTAGNPSSQIRILRSLVVGDKLVFRNAQAGGLVVTGSGTQSLQDAYSIGATITTTVGNPFTVGGLAAKVAQFNGDIGVTGVIDPKGITFIPQASNPLGVDNGLWVGLDGSLMHSQDGSPDVNISASLAANGTAIRFPMNNDSGASLAATVPIAQDEFGSLSLVDVSDEASANACMGIVADSAIADGDSGDIVNAGRLQNVTTSFSFGDVLYIDKAGALTNVKPNLGDDGFVAGDWVVRVALVTRNVDNAMQKDFIVNVQVVGQV